MGLMRRTPTKRLTAAVTVAAALTVGLPAAAIALSNSATPVIQGLDGPRGIAVSGKGKVVFAEADGSFSLGITSGRHKGEVKQLGSVPAGGIAPALDIGGHGKIFIGGHGKIFVLTAFAEPPATGGFTLYR